MTKDVIALTEKMPDPASILAGLFAGGPDLGIRPTADGAVIQLCTPGGHPLLAVDAPLLIQVPGEATRLLGPGVSVPDGPLWWTETRACASAPEAERLAHSFTGRLTTLLGGTTWPDTAATTDVIPLAPESAALTAPDTALPAADVLSDDAAVLLIDRPRLALTTHLADVLRTANARGLALQIVTPPHTRLTLPLRTALGPPPNRWVVQDDDCGYYDGLSGAVLHWQSGAFAVTRAPDGTTTPAKAFTTHTDTDTDERQLIVSLHTRHTPNEHLILGRALETAWQHLTGTPPAGWSTAEPVNLPWSPRQLTELARTRAQRQTPTHLTAVGHPDRPALATIHITHTSAGVEENITLALGYAPDEAPPLTALEPLATTLTTEHGLATMLTSLRAAPRDLTILPRFSPTPTPVSFTLGPGMVGDIGLDHARHTHLPLQPVPLGPTSRPGLHYPLGDGTDAKASWTTLQRLTQHLKTT